jgi:predicted transglutaminase-like cysteine proteinase
VHRLLALSLLIASPTAPAVTPVVKPPQFVIPRDNIARAKFPHVNGRLIDELAFINALVNTAMVYEDDQKHYGVPDLWVMMPSDGRGDCEDYALTKMFLIMRLDDAQNDPIDPVTSEKLVPVMVHYKEKGKWQSGGHAVLALKLPDRSVMYLDLNFDEPMTRRELVEHGYQFFDWRA